MKNILKYGFFLALVCALGACEEDGLVLEPDVVIPSNVTASFTVSDDNTGTVTVTPAGDGAAAFQILFGDEPNEEPTVIVVGESATNVYPEGNFILSVTAVSVTGGTTTITQDIIIQFDPPENLQVDIQVNGLMATVTPSADGAAIFDVFFGVNPDPALDSMAMVMPNQSASFTYPEAGEFVITTIARGAGAAIVQQSDTINVFANIALPVDFESATPEFVVFGGTSNPGIVANPGPGGINESANVASVTKDQGAETFAGVVVRLTEPIDFSQMQFIRLDVFSPRSGIPITLRAQDQADFNIGVEATVTNTLADGWEELVFDLSAVDQSQNLNEIVIFFDNGNPGDGTTYFFDNIELFSAAPPLELPVNFEGDQSGIAFTGFEGATSAVVANPNASGVNTSATVGMTNKGAGAPFFAGSFFDLDVPVNFSQTQTITMDVFVPQSDIVVMMRLEPAGGGGGPAGVEVPVRTTLVNEWETLTYDFSTTTFDIDDFVRVVFFFDFENDGTGADYFFDNIQMPVASAPLELPVDFEDDQSGIAFTGFEGATSAVVANPNASGVNTSATVGMTNKGAGAPFFAGSFFDLDVPVDFSQDQIITMDVFVPQSDIVVMMRLEPAGGGGGPAGVEVPVRTTLVNEWETLTYDFSTTTFDIDDFVRVVFFFDFENAGTGADYFFDNIQMSSTPPPPPINLVLPLNFEGDQAGVAFTGFEGATSAVVANPQATGVNTTASVGMTNKAAGAPFFAGSFVDLTTPIDLSQTQTITMDVLVPQSDIVVMMRLEPAGGGGGDQGVEVPVRTTMVNEWETLTYDFSTTNFNVNPFVRVVFFFDFENDGTGADYFFDNIDLDAAAPPPPPPAQLVLPLDFEGDQTGVAFTGFEGATSAVVSNPNVSGINTSANVGMTNKGAGAPFFAGSFVDLTTTIDFSQTQTISMDVLVPQADIVVMMRLEPAGGGGGDQGVEVPVRTTMVNQWETLTYDFSTTNFNVNPFVRVVFFFDFENDGTGADYFFDNVRQGN